MTLAAPTKVAVVPAVMKKTGLVWLEVGTHPAVAVWHVWHNEVCYVLHSSRKVDDTDVDDTEQVVTGLAEAVQCHVITRSVTTRARTARWRGTVHPVVPDCAEWDELLPLLIAKRLNLTDADRAAQRWARDCVLSRIVPTESAVG